MLIMHTSSAIDVFTGTPLDFQYSPHKDEVSLTLEIISRQKAPKTLFILDRLYIQTKIIKAIKDDQYFIIRCKKSSSFKAVDKFVLSGKAEEYINLCSKKIRLIRINLPKGGVLILATNLGKSFCKKEIESLYRFRWEIETTNRETTDTQKIEEFHATDLNGILQEIYAGMILRAFTKIEIARNFPPPKVNTESYRKPNFKELFTFIKENLFSFVFKISLDLYEDVKTIIKKTLEKRMHYARTNERKVVNSKHRRYKKDTTRPRTFAAEGGGTLG